MRKNLTTRTVIIVATILVCLYGIFGIPKSRAELTRNMQKNIRLGLDLKGGSHLILQVQVQDAMKSEADHTIERLKESLRKVNIDYASIERNDPTTVEAANSIEITIKGIPSQKTSEFRSLISEQFGTWNLTPINASDYRMNLKPSELVNLKRETVERSIQTIDNRINALGLTEPVVQQHGRAGEEYEILVQLPGVDDPAQVKEIIRPRRSSRSVRSRMARSRPRRPCARNTAAFFR